jgi:hypothetical protein
MSTTQSPLEYLWQFSFDTLYDTLYQELCSEAVVNRWERIHTGVTILVGSTASGSAIAGWAFWSQTGWRNVWAVLAGLAAVGSLVESAIAVPRRIQEQEELRRHLSALRISLQTFRQDLLLGADLVEGRKRYNELRQRYETIAGSARKDLALTEGLRVRVQTAVDLKLKDEVVP